MKCIKVFYLAQKDQFTTAHYCELRTSSNPDKSVVMQSNSELKHHKGSNCLQ